MAMFFLLIERILGAYTPCVGPFDLCVMIKQAPNKGPVLTPFHEHLREELKAYWRCAQRFHFGPGDYGDPNGQAMLAAEKAILKKLGLPSRSFRFSDPIQRFGFETYCYPELVVQCANELIEMAETYLLSPAKGTKTLLREALEDKTPAMELFSELDMPTTAYVMFLYYEYFLQGQIGVDDFISYLQFIRNYRTPHGREIPFDVAGLRHKRMLNALINENLWFFDEYLSFLRYNEERPEWEFDKRTVVVGIDCDNDTNLIVDSLFITRIEHKLTYNDIRMEAIIPIHGMYHQITVYCNANLFNQLMAGARYHQYSARVLEGIKMAKENNVAVYAFNVNDVINRSLEIDGCCIELCTMGGLVSMSRSRTKPQAFKLVDIDLRSSNSSIIDD